jgi:radical SAM superfamily enzyme YgiQ (UPF0313 family)
MLFCGGKKHQIFYRNTGYADLMKIKIALLDLNHTTLGIHTNTVPLGLGLISRYVKKVVEEDVEIKMFKVADKAMDIFKSWIPDILGMAQYCWNSELNLFVAMHVKKINPDCLVVAGGPDLELSSSRKKVFLKERDCIDICVEFDGEIPFAEIVKRCLSGESHADVKLHPGAGTYSFESQSCELIQGMQPPPRLESLDEFGAIYADGFFDKLLDDGFHPFVQTHRGCPYTCTFCHTSDSYYSKMLFQSPETFERDMNYLGKRFTGQDHVTLYIANTNMGQFKQDFEIGRIIRETQEKYNWPRMIDVNSGKDPKKLLEMVSIVNFPASIALQTNTPDVLQNIKRKNIPFDKYVVFQKDLMSKSKYNSATELILCLPGETKETFLNTLRDVINSGVQNIAIYTMMNLKGTPISSVESSERYNHIIRHRIVPRQFSTINGIKIMDTEEVVVATKDMSFEDYVSLRGLSFIVATFLGSAELNPLKRFLLGYKMDIAEWIFSISDRLSEYPELYQNHKAFLKETEDELFLSREALIAFYHNHENFEALCSGRLGDNLLRKYKLIVLSENYESCLELAVSVVREIIHDSFEDHKKIDVMIDDLTSYLLTRNMKPFLSGKYSYHKQFHLNYDIPLWLVNSDPELLLKDFNSTCDYTATFTDDTIRRLKNIVEMNKDLTLSLQILYRDGTMREYWPQWVRDLD